MLLHQCPRVTWIGLQVQHPVGMGIKHPVVLYFLERRQPHYRASPVQTFPLGCRFKHRSITPLLLRRTDVSKIDVGVHHLFHPPRAIHAGRVHLHPVFGCVTADKHRATNVGDALQPIASGQSVGNFHNGPLGIAIQQQVGGRIYQDGTPNAVLPVVVVSDTPQRRFYTTQHNGRFRIGLAAALRVGNGTAIRTAAALAPRCVRIVGSNLAISRIPVDHRIHVASGHAEKQVGFAQCFERLRAMPVRLRDNPHTESLIFE